MSMKEHYVCNMQPIEAIGGQHEVAAFVVQSYAAQLVLLPSKTQHERIALEESDYYCTS